MTASDDAAERCASCGQVLPAPAPTPDHPAPVPPEPMGVEEAAETMTTIVELCAAAGAAAAMPALLNEIGANRRKWPCRAGSRAEMIAQARRELVARGYSSAANVALPVRTRR
jgi:hypothetical protein